MSIHDKAALKLNRFMDRFIGELVPERSEARREEMELYLAWIDELSYNAK